MQFCKISLILFPSKMKTHGNEFMRRSQMQIKNNLISFFRSNSRLILNVLFELKEKKMNRNLVVD